MDKEILDKKFDILAKAAIDVSIKTAEYCEDNGLSLEEFRLVILLAATNGLAGFFYACKYGESPEEAAKNTAEHRNKALQDLKEYAEFFLKEEDMEDGDNGQSN